MSRWLVYFSHQIHSPQSFKYVEDPSEIIFVAIVKAQKVWLNYPRVNNSKFCFLCFVIHFCWFIPLETLLQRSTSDVHVVRFFELIRYHIISYTSISHLSAGYLTTWGLSTPYFLMKRDIFRLFEFSPSIPRELESGRVFVCVYLCPSHHYIYFAVRPESQTNYSLWKCPSDNTSVIVSTCSRLNAYSEIHLQQYTNSNIDTDANHRIYRPTPWRTEKWNKYFFTSFSFSLIII